jgi:hypothetical protein
MVDPVDQSKIEDGKTYQKLVAATRTQRSSAKAACVYLANALTMQGNQCTPRKARSLILLVHVLTAWRCRHSPRSTLHTVKKEDVGHCYLHPVDAELLHAPPHSWHITHLSSYFKCSFFAGDVGRRIPVSCARFRLCHRHFGIG